MRVNELVFFFFSASIFTPFISTSLLDISILIPVLVFGGMSIIAAVCSHFLPRETFQMKLDEEEESFEPDLVQNRAYNYA